MGRGTTGFEITLRENRGRMGEEDYGFSIDVKRGGYPALCGSDFCKPTTSIESDQTCYQGCYGIGRSVIVAYRRTCAVGFQPMLLVECFTA